MGYAYFRLLGQGGGMIRARYKLKIRGTKIGNTDSATQSILLKELKAGLYDALIDTEDINETHFWLVKNAIANNWVKYTRIHFNKYTAFSFELKVYSLTVK